MRADAAMNLVTQSSALNSDEEFGIVDGYLVDDPQILRMELQDTFNLMSVSRLKLMQYVKTLRKYIPGHQVDELHQTLDGIEELCSLLKPKHHLFLNVAGPVDTAIEATNETSFKTRQPPKTLNIKHKNLPEENPQPQQASQAVNSLNSRYEVPDNKISKSASRFINNRKEVEMHVFHDFKNFVFENEEGVPPIDPAGDRRNSE
jgi:TBC1 domain family protein 5